MINKSNFQIQDSTPCFFIQDIRQASNELFYINSVINSLKMEGAY